MAKGRNLTRPATTPPPKGQTHTRASFHLPRELLADLRRLVGDLKADATAAGRPAPSLSEVTEAALRAEIAKRKKDA